MGKVYVMGDILSQDEIDRMLSDKNSVEVNLELDDKTLLGLALLAHTRNITLNDMVVSILAEQLEKDKCNG